MSELEIYYSEQELDHIDQLIETKVSKQLDQQIHNCVLAQMQPLFGQVDYSLFRNLSEKVQSMPEELVICELFSILNNQHSKVARQLNAIIESKDGLITELQQNKKVLREELSFFQSHRQRLQKAVLQADKSMIELNHKLFIQNDKILTQQQQIIELQSLLQDRDNTISQKQQERQSMAASRGIELDRLKQQLESVVKERDSLNEFIFGLQQELSQEIQKRSMNLVTFTIQSDEAALKHKQAIDMFQKVQSIHNENARIVALLSQIHSKLITYDLVDLKVPLKHIETNYQTLCQEMMAQQNKISKLSSICDKNIIAQIENDKQLLQQLKRSKLMIKQYQMKEDKQRKQEQEMRQKIAVLEKTIHHLTDSNYKILLDLQQGKAKIEESYFRECELTRSLSEELDLMKELLNASKTKMQVLEMQLRQEIQFNREKERKNMQALIKYQQLEQIYSSLKQSIGEKLGTYRAEENSQFQLLEHLIDKNENLTKQLATTRAKLSSLDYEKQVSCELKENMEKELIQKMQTVDYTINTNKILKEENERYGAALKASQSELHLLKMRLIQKEQMIASLNNQLITMQPTAQKMEKQVQTQNMNSVRQSQIRRQKVSTNLASSQLSYLQISDDEQLKQNTLNALNRTSNLHKFKYKNGEPNQAKTCNHLQKIGALNEIINYFMNYIKGYMGRAVRSNSWLASLILKYGEQYQLKLMEEGNLQTKVKNVKRIEEICMKEKPCSRLIQQFESVMEYYFQERTAVLREKSLNGTISKSRLTKTVNRCVGNDRTVIYRVRNE